MEAPICRNCKVFFGCQEGLCSKCFKESKAPSPAERVPSPLPQLVEEAKETPKIETPKPDRCFSCKKVLGPMHFQCKCSNYFCTRHRHPEDHRCEYDHKSEGIRKLVNENPLVEAPKFTKL